MTPGNVQVCDVRHTYMEASINSVLFRFGTISTFPERNGRFMTITTESKSEVFAGPLPTAICQLLFPWAPGALRGCVMGCESCRTSFRWVLEFLHLEKCKYHGGGSVVLQHLPCHLERSPPRRAKSKSLS